MTRKSWEAPVDLYPVSTTVGAPTPVQPLRHLLAEADEWLEWIANDGPWPILVTFEVSHDGIAVDDDISQTQVYTVAVGKAASLESKPGSLRRWIGCIAESADGNPVHTSAVRSAIVLSRR